MYRIGKRTNIRILPAKIQSKLMKMKTLLQIVSPWAAEKTDKSKADASYHVDGAAAAGDS